MASGRQPRQPLVHSRRRAAFGRLTYVRILMPAGDWIAAGMTGLVDAGDKAPPSEKEPNPANMDEATAKAYVAFVNMDAALNE